jgi:dTDP-4-dehydrorhamnose reductase/UDP-glucose 4-epimerase
LIPRTLVIGRKSFLAKALTRKVRERGLEKAFDFVAHDELPPRSALAGYGCVINFALNPAYMTQSYDESYDFERYVARQLAELPTRLIMISSRKVYAPSLAFGASEVTPAEGADIYGRSKLVTERALAEILGSRLTVFRLANTVGYDMQPARPTFMARMLSSLKTVRRITYDVDPGTRRDFISDDAVAAVMIAATEGRMSGTYNLGSGVALAIGKLANWLIEGYGAGELIVESKDVRDEFVLNVAKLEAIVGRICPESELRRACIEAGKRLSFE